MTACHIKQTVGGEGKGQGTSKTKILQEDGTVKEVVEKSLINQNRGTLNQNGYCPLSFDYKSVNRHHIILLRYLR